MSILRRKPVRPEALKSCSDVIDADADVIDLESLSGESHTSEYRDSIFESPMLKQFKKSQHFLKIKIRYPIIVSQATQQASCPQPRVFPQKATVWVMIQVYCEGRERDLNPPSPRPVKNHQRLKLRRDTPTSHGDEQYAGFSPPTKQKLGLKRSNAKRTKTPPSPNTKLAQHKSYDPKC